MPRDRPARVCKDESPYFDRCPIARSYYNAEDAAKLIADTVEIYKASYRKIGLIK